MIVISGSAYLESNSISPKPLIPISSTRISVSSGASKIVWQNPISLLWLRGVLKVLNFSERTDAASSFVVVFPELPVIATTVKFSFFLL